jgi:hypothetical protein
VEFVYIQYRIAGPDAPEVNLRLRFDPNTFESVEATPAVPPAWTALDFHQCPNCPLEVARQARCPAAVRLAPALEKCAALAPGPVQAEVSTPDRGFSAQLPLARVLSSLVGLIMATSGCPRTRFLLPMARFHLPFANDDETLYRAASMYLLGQYYQHKQGHAPDIELEGLAALYRELQTVNTAMTTRLKASAGDSRAAQALVSLDLFSHSLPFDIKSSLARIRRLFET